MINDKYSGKDFTHHTFLDVDPSEFNNSTIKGTCFYYEIMDGRVGYIQIFPTGITEVIFENCNLDNIFIPPGNTIIDGCHRCIKIQNDLEDWITDKDGNPQEPMSKDQFKKLGIPIDPEYIPLEKQDERITAIVEETLEILERQ